MGAGFRLALEQAVSRVVRMAKDAARSRRYTMAEVLASASERPLKELALLVLMELVFPGSGPFPVGRVYELFPPGTDDSKGAYRPHPFDVLSDSGELHQFAGMQGLRWATWKINEILTLHIDHHAEAMVLTHLRYHGVPPGYDNSLGSGLPLLAMPLMICQGHLG